MDAVLPGWLVSDTWHDLVEHRNALAPTCASSCLSCGGMVFWVLVMEQLGQQLRVAAA
jgi:hypothetical protein